MIGSASIIVGISVDLWAVVVALASYCIFVGIILIAALKGEDAK